MHERVGDEERWQIIFAGLDLLNERTARVPTATPSSAPTLRFSLNKLDTAVSFGFTLSEDNTVATRSEGASATCIAAAAIPRNRRAVVTFHVRRLTPSANFTVGLIPELCESMAAAPQKVLFGPGGIVCNEDTLPDAQILEQGDVVEFHVLQRDDFHAKLHVFKNLDQIYQSAFVAFAGPLFPAVSLSAVGD